MPEIGTIFWLILLIVFVVAESITTTLVSIWFAGGALVSLIMFIAGASVSQQIIGFAIASAVLLILTRPFVRKMTKKTRHFRQKQAVFRTYFDFCWYFD